MYIFMDCNLVIHYTKEVKFLDSLSLGHVFEYFDGYIVNALLLTKVIFDLWMQKSDALFEH